jgi:hypothetical protein
MNRIITAQVRARAAVENAVARRIVGPRDRGDVPGWVLVTIMTAGLVTALWAIAGPQLGDLFSDAISDVKGP